MNQFHAMVNAAGLSGEDEAQQAAQEEPGDAQAAERGKQHHGEPPTVLAAEALSRTLLDRRLKEKEKQVAGPVMHYGFGATMGSVYGGTAEVLPLIKAGKGAGYGTLVWLAADEAAVPALGLAKPPTQHAPSTHVAGLADHVVFGLVAESVRRTVRMLL